MPPRRDSLSPAQREREQREREREERDRRDRERARERERDREREQRDREREQDREREERPPAKSAPGAAGAMAGPPQMGQLLSAQATRPTLCNTFFVGDVFTKHACTRLQSLAANVRIVNMYGAIETQRAVSYSAIPSVADNPAFLATQKNIMPAGERMTDFQLLVVNRNDRDIPCAVGEVGEIYVVIY